MADEVFLIDILNADEISIIESPSKEDISDIFTAPDPMLNRDYFVASRAYHLGKALKLIGQVDSSELLVIAPNYYFGFRIDSEIYSKPTRHGRDELGAGGSIDDVFRQISNLGKGDNPTPVDILFFDEPSKINFEQQRTSLGLNRLDVADIPINGGVIKLYRYALSQTTSPTI